MTTPEDITSPRPVWFAEVRYIASTDGPIYDYHQRDSVEGGPYFNVKRVAQRWCEAKMAELIGAGIHPSELEAVLDRGHWTWPVGQADLRVFVEDEPFFSYSGRSHPDRHQWQWTYDGDAPSGTGGATP